MEDYSSNPDAGYRQAEADAKYESEQIKAAERRGGERVLEIMDQVTNKPYLFLVDDAKKLIREAWEKTQDKP